MKNVTVSLEDEVALWARVKAAEQDRSLSSFLSELLRERMSGDRRYEEAMRDYLERPASRLKRSGRYPGRDEIHERPRLR